MSTSDNPVFDGVQSIIAEILLVEADGISMETGQPDIKNWDSMQHINIMLALEQSFGVYFTPEEFTELNSVQTIVDRIGEKQL